jgi:hypothetical protein
MGQIKSSPDQRLIEYAVDRVVDETNTDTKILVLARQDGTPDSFPIWTRHQVGARYHLDTPPDEPRLD